MKETHLAIVFLFLQILLYNDVRKGYFLLLKSLEITVLASL